VPDNERSRPQEAGPAPTTTATNGPVIVPDAGDPRRVGELLGDWLAIRMAEVDDLVGEARSKVEAIPDRRGLLVLIGELVLRVGAVEHELTELRKAAER
jgi:hypothetical protein